MGCRGWSVICLALLFGFPAGARAQADRFFDDGVLHDLHLSLHGDDWRRLQEGYLENTYYPADVTWNGERIRNAGIRSRGNASRNSRKPGLRIDVDRYVTDQRFLGLKSFVLDNLVQDASGLKERLAMRVFERMGLPAPREVHARLFVNGSYIGTYAIVESIDKDFVARVYAAHEDAGGRRERDGTLFDYRWNYPYYFSYLGPELQAYAPLFEAQTDETHSPEQLYGPIRDLCRLLDETSDDEFVDIVGRYLDLEQWVRYVAVEAFLAELDGMLGFAGMNNFYLYRFEQSTLSQVIPWDKDQSFTSARQSIWNNADTNAMMRRAMVVPELRRAFLQTLVDCAELAMSREGDDARGWLEREIDRAFDQVRESMQADAARPQSHDEFLAEVERLREFARTRSRFVTCEVASELDAHHPLCTPDETTATRR